MGISIDFFSSGYLDVSVPRVRLLHLCIQCKIPVKGGFPHSEISGSKSVCRLPEAYRRLQRPSSPSAAKASTRCTSLLDHIIQRTFNLLGDLTAHLQDASPPLVSVRFDSLDYMHISLQLPMYSPLCRNKILNTF